MISPTMGGIVLDQQQVEIADVSPAEYRGTAFGMFNLLSGAGLLGASGLAGWLWDRQGPAATFWMGAAIALAATLCVPIFSGKAAPPHS
jgi:predicted MFS family arabinose efflux permease